jgi:hypothetical protein
MSATRRVPEDLSVVVASTLPADILSVLGGAASAEDVTKALIDALNP